MKTKHQFKTAPALVVAVFALSLSSCKTRPPAPAPGDSISPGPAAAVTAGETGKQKAEIVLKSILEGMRNDDYSVYSAHFAEGLKKELTEEKFKKTNEAIKKQLGNCSEHQFLGKMKKNVFDVFLWKAQFTGTEDESLIRLVLGQVDDQYRVFGFWIQ